MKVGSKALCLKRTGGWTATNTVSIDEALFTAIVYINKHTHTHTPEFNTNADGSKLTKNPEPQC